MHPQFSAYDVIDQIRNRPAMYLGFHSLIRLRAYLGGCYHVVEELGIPVSDHTEFHGFHDWVAKHFGWRESTAGWCNIIVQECGGDDAKALERFFELLELLDEYRKDTNS